MSPVDDKVDHLADGLDRLVRSGKREGGVKAKVARMFEDDPDFLRQLKPSLIAARAKGDAPTDREPPQPAPPTRRPKPKASKRRGGPSPFVVLGACLAVGIALAHGLDWLGHRYPRD